ncbi:glycoside hydrolase family 3 C-terminal domain-containing protein [Boeremia exigua]|uniref:glycoside hydrolase family 3 C-terminal domain-containing protein n=1 Tax=Boeremia exigua TaxID=749465 RepID=UPI001E8DBD42|nr:glycoside hydrolase family 3 C-terminal domain-containing protein [Boeremia exigua]KAH6628957.1 glycoside hydrolase family 3 C-terminal domain-containing protein [Boeremia exigua]
MMCPNTIVMTHGPGVVLMPWADNENVTAILAAHYPDEESGNSIVDVLWGVQEPSGRLPYTIPRTASDYGLPIVEHVDAKGDPNAWQADFTESQLIDYRHFDASAIDPIYRFGFGLSYTTFEMDDVLNVEITGGSLTAYANESMGFAPGGLHDLAGFAVPQLYVSLPQDTTPSGTPMKVLRGFKKVRLDASETKQVEFELTRRDISYWNVEETA